MAHTDRVTCSGHLLLLQDNWRLESSTREPTVGKCTEMHLREYEEKGVNECIHLIFTNPCILPSFLEKTVWWSDVSSSSFHTWYSLLFPLPLPHTVIKVMSEAVRRNTLRKTAFTPTRPTVPPRDTTPCADREGRVLGVRGFRGGAHLRTSGDHWATSLCREWSFFAAYFLWLSSLALSVVLGVSA